MGKILTHRSHIVYITGMSHMWMPVHKHVVIGSHLFVMQLSGTLIVKAVSHLTIKLIATLFFQYCINGSKMCDPDIEVCNNKKPYSQITKIFVQGVTCKNFI